MKEHVSEAARLAEQFHAASDDARHELLLQAARSPDTTWLAEEACTLLAAAGAGRRHDREGIDDDSLALSIAAGRVSREALEDPAVVVWLLACLSPEPAVSHEERSPVAVSAVTRKRIDALTRPGRWRSRRGALFVSLTMAAAAVLATVAFLGPASDEWARSLGLSRVRTWRLDPALAAAAQRAATTGELTAALFERTGADPRRERAVDPSGTAPIPRYPRWEAVRGTRPEFRFEPRAGGEGETTGFELFVVDANRNLVWSAVADSDGRLAYPGDAAPLEPGGVYYWKVNREGGARLVASPYVALQVLDDAGERALEDDLDSAGGHPFLKGVVYDRHGLYTAAVDAFDRAAAKGYAPAVSARAAVLAKQDLAP